MIEYLVLSLNAQSDGQPARTNESEDLNVYRTTN